LRRALAAELNHFGGKKRRGHQFTPAFRILWLVISTLLDNWEDLVHVVKPETVK